MIREILVMNWIIVIFGFFFIFVVMYELEGFIVGIGNVGFGKCDYVLKVI